MTDSGKRAKGLGRGLSSLLAGDGEEETREEGGPPRSVPIEFVIPNPNQPRKEFDKGELDALANSIRQRGIIQPIVVRPDPEAAGKFQIIAGERRWRAAQIAKLHDVPVVVREVDDTELIELAIIENIQRADLNPIEEAAGYTALMDRYDHTQEAVAKVVGKSRSHIANMTRLLGLPAKVRQMLADGLLTAGHGRTLIGADDALALAQQIVKGGLNVRAAESLVKAEKKPARPAKKKPARDPDTLALEADLVAALGLPVSINYRDGAGGDIKLSYKSLDQLDEICRRLCQVPNNHL